MWSVNSMRRSAQRSLAPLLAGWLIYAGLMLSAHAHDFGGNTNGGGPDSPPPAPPCNSCPCNGPGSGGNGGGFPGNSSGNPSGSGGKPVSLFNGAEELTQSDLVVNGVFPIQVERKYDSRSSYDSALGYGWSFLHDRRLYEYPDNSILVRHGCGTRDRYVQNAGAYVSSAGGMLATLSQTTDGGFQLRYLNGVVDRFDSQGRLIVVTDARGNRHEYTYDARGKLPLVGASKESVAPTSPMTVAYNFRLTRIDVRGRDGALTGRFVTFGYDESTGRVTSVTADDGRAITYQHDTTQGLTLGNLTQVNGLENTVSIFGYADPFDSHNATSIKLSQSRIPVLNTYDDQDRVIRQEEGTRQMDIVYNAPYTRSTLTRTIRDDNGLNPYTSTSVYEFDSTGRVTKLVNGLGHETRYAYDAAKQLSRKEIWQKSGTTLSLLQAMDWTHDADGNITSLIVTLDSGEVITRTWTYQRRWMTSMQTVTSLTPTRIFRTEYTLYVDSDGEPTNIQSEKRRRDDGTFQTTTYTYDPRNRLLSATLPDGVQMLNEYTGDYVTRSYFVAAGVEQPQLARRFEYDAEGNLIKQWDGRNNLTTYDYDQRHRVVRMTNPLGQQSLYTYEQDRLLQVERGRTIVDGEGLVTRMVYDNRDRLTGMQRKNDSGLFVDYWTFRLDSEGQRVAVTDAENRTTRMAYDLLDRLRQTTDALGNVSQAEYDAADRYVLVRDALSREIRYEYDDLDRMTAIVELGVTPNARTELSYDAANNLLAVTDSEGHTTAYRYDALSRNTRVTQPLGQFVQFGYDGRDRLAAVTNARGGRILYGYEPWGPLKAEMQYPDGSATTPERTIDYSRDHDGNILSVLDSDIQPGIAYATTYDPLGRVFDETFKYIPGGDKLLKRRYDRYGNRSELILQDAAPVTHTYTYNKLNHMTAATLDGAPISVEYLANDDWQRVTLPNGIVESYNYQANGPLTQIRFNGPSSQLEQLSYGYDSALNLDTQSDQYGTHDFNYDGLNRLIQALRPAASGLPNENYVYDRIANREDPSNTSLYSYDNNNRISTALGVGYTFDADGSVRTRSDGATFVHDTRNRLRQFVKGPITAGYLYEIGARRIRKTVGAVTTWYLWDGTRLLAEYSATGDRSQRYAYLGTREVPVQLQNGGGIYYIHADHLQTPRFLSNAAAQVVWKSRHEAFGKALVDDDPDGDGHALTFNLRFPGQYFDAESGLHDNYARQYDAALGRYVQYDPIGLMGGPNGYAYGDANPLTISDPTGTNTIAIGVRGGATVGGLVGGPPGAIIGAVIGAGIGIGISWWLLRSWTCSASCNVQQIDPCAQCPDRVSGSAGGPSEEAACRAAKRSATQSTPRGCYARHCQCSCSR